MCDRECCHLPTSVLPSAFSNRATRSQLQRQPPRKQCFPAPLLSLHGVIWVCTGQSFTLCSLEERRFPCTSFALLLFWLEYRHDSWNWSCCLGSWPGSFMLRMVEQEIGGLRFFDILECLINPKIMLWHWWEISSILLKQLFFGWSPNWYDAVLVTYRYNTAV